MEHEPAPVTTTTGPPEEAYRNGIDLTQIRYMLSLTPAERLRVLEEAAASLADLCDSAKFPVS